MWTASKLWAVRQEDLDFSLTLSFPPSKMPIHDVYSTRVYKDWVKEDVALSVFSGGKLIYVTNKADICAKKEEYFTSWANFFFFFSCSSLENSKWISLGPKQPRFEVKCISVANVLIEEPRESCKRKYLHIFLRFKSTYVFFSFFFSGFLLMQEDKNK